MAYLAPIHRPSSVRHALKLKFLEEGEECLVVAKANRIEIYTQTADGLHLSHSQAIYGKINMLEKLQPENSPTEHLFVGTDRYMYFTVSWDARKQQLRTEKSYVDQTDKTARDSLAQDRCLLDPTHKFLALQLYDGIVTVVPIAGKGRRKGDPDAGTLGEPALARISDLFIRSSTFLHPRNDSVEAPRIAFLFEDNRQKACLNIRVLDYTAGGGGDPGNADLEEVTASRDDLEVGASHLIPVPAPAFGLLILAETSITYWDDVTGQELTHGLEEAAIFVAWEQVDGQRWILADEYGRLYFCMLILEKDRAVKGFKIDMIGSTPRASVLVYLHTGYVFVGSHQGDSQVLRIKEEGSEVVQTISNIAPILDFSIMDMGSRGGESQTNEYSSGQARIVTGSGAFQDGSLRSVRSGVGMEEQGLLGDLDHITDLFALRSAVSSEHVDLLVVSFVGETRVFQFSAEGEVEEQAEYMGLSLSESTILAVNLPHNRLLQVTGTSVLIIDSENGMVVAHWSPLNGKVITAASANPDHLALSVGGVEATVLDLMEDLQVSSRRAFDSEGQIACIHIPRFTSSFCIAGFWHGGTVAILNTGSLETIQTVTVSDEAVSVPRSILLTHLVEAQPPTLLVAMANGEVITFSLDLADLNLSAKKVVILGTQQANFKVLPRDDGLSNVFATCEHPSLIYGSEGRIIYSAVTAEKASCICAFDSEAYPGAIAIATAEDLKIAVVDTERTTHVQTLPVHETVRRVAYSTNMKAFGLGTIRRTLRAGFEVVQSHFKLADEVLFKELDTYQLDEDELVESVVRADLREDSGVMAERFVIGTAYLDDSKENSTRGRIIVFAVTGERMLKVITELPVKGACRALGVVEGNIVAALVKTVVIYTLSANSLRKVASYRTSTAPIDLTVNGNVIAIADLMKSVSIVEYERGEAGLPDKLTETARHFQTAWATAVAQVEENSYLESDAEGNLMVLHRNTNGVTDDDKRRLEVTSEIRLGEMVNRIRTFNVPTSANAVVVPRAFLATVEGSIYLFALLPPSTQSLLINLQNALAPLLPSPGNIPFFPYRAFCNQVRHADEPFRFVDGELVERFLDLEEGVAEEVVKGLQGQGGPWDVDSVRGVVERLRRLR